MTTTNEERRAAAARRSNAYRERRRRCAVLAPVAVPLGTLLALERLGLLMEGGRDREAVVTAVEAYLRGAGAVATLADSLRAAELQR